jgi:ribosomal protein S12 methylthiotransferase
LHYTCGFIDNAKAESVNMILEYADKKKRENSSRQSICNWMLIERYRPDLEKKEIPNVDQFWNY